MNKMRLSLFVFLLLSKVWSYAQTNAIANTGNVGIGTLMPTATLSIKGDANIVETNEQPSGRFTFAGGAYLEKFIGGSWLNMPTNWSSGIGHGGAGVNPWIAYVSSYGHWFNNADEGDVAYRNLNGKLLFGTSMYVPTMTVKDYNVGIGTKNPGERLHLSGGNMFIESPTLGSGNGSGALLRLGASSYSPWHAGLGITQGSGIDVYDLDFYTVSQTDPSIKMKLSAEGKLGIGTNNPQALLHLSSTNSGIFIEGQGNDHEPYVRLKGSAGEGFLDNKNISTSLAGGIGLQAASNNGRLSLGVIPSRGTVTYSENPALVTHNVVGALGQTVDIFQVSQYSSGSLGNFQSTPVLRVKSSGKVAIGTEDPKDYTLAVEGWIGTRKLVVTKNPNWADYVFNDDYKLPTLQEVEAYIRQHKHLPGIVSAKEVEKDGLDVGENQAALLKKIEELTLYVIEMEKTLKAQQTEIRELKHVVRSKQ